MKNDEYINCFGCNALSLNIEGDVHKYMLSSPGCWAMFLEIMDREFSDIKYYRAHQFTVDAYACQHVGNRDDQRAVNSVNIHLAALYAIFERNWKPDDTARFRSIFSQHYKGRKELKWLEPPASMGGLTIYDLWENSEPDRHLSLAEAWARSVWEAWGHQHDRIAEIVKKTGVFD